MRVRDPEKRAQREKRYTDIDDYFPRRPLAVEAKKAGFPRLENNDRDTQQHQAKVADQCLAKPFNNPVSPRAVAVEKE